MSGLPSGYKQLEYIQSSGTQYIDTNFIPNNNTRVVADFQITKTNAWQAVFGAWEYTSTYVNSFVFLATSSNVFRTDYGAKSSTFSNSVSINARHKIDHNKTSVTLDSTSITHSQASFTASCKLNIFSGNTGGTASEFASMKLYSCQIYDNGTLVRDFVPCRKTDGTIGLWDDVNSVFYGNAGTGTFTAGPEIIPDPPAAPAGLQTVLAVALQWAASENADRYDVYRDGAKLGSTETTQYVDTTPEVNQTYVYTVKAVNGGGESDGTSITVYTKSGYFEYKPLIESANFP